jgi:hypothetical protein
LYDCQFASGTKRDTVFVSGHTADDKCRRIKINFEALDKVEFARSCGSAEDDAEIFAWFQAMKENVDQSTIGKDRHKAIDQRLLQLVERAVVACGSTMEDAATASGFPPEFVQPTPLMSESDDDDDIASFTVVSPPAKKMRRTSKHAKSAASNDSAEEENYLYDDDVQVTELEQMRQSPKKSANTNDTRPWTKHRIFPPWKIPTGRIGQFCLAEGKYGQRPINDAISTVVEDLTIQEPETDVGPIVTFFIDPDLTPEQVHTHTHLHNYTHTHTHIQTCTHTHTHTHRYATCTNTISNSTARSCSVSPVPSINGTACTVHTRGVPL